MKKTSLLFTVLAFSLPLPAREGRGNEEEVYENHVGEVNYLTGEEGEIGGFMIPSLFVQGTGGVFEPGATPGDFATSEHDPANEGGIQGVEPHLALNFQDVVTGAVAGFAHQGEDEVWELALEEAFLQWHLNEIFSLGGGQFFTRAGFQQDLHLHDWFFVNQNLPNSRLINEGELITQGGEILLRLPESSLLTFGFGGVRSHVHDEEEGESTDPNFIEGHRGDLQNSVVSADYRFRLPFDESISGSLSAIGGKNGFGLETQIYGGGFRKVWNGHDHGQGGRDFCAGAVMLQGEFFTREVEALTLGGAPVNFNDQGLATSVHYGLSDRTTASLRYDWISDVAQTEFTEHNRLSTALTAFVDPAQRVRMRLQYDYTDTDAVGSEHVAWLQIQLQWGGNGGSHAGHGH